MSESPPTHIPLTNDAYLAARIRKLGSVRQMHFERAVESIYHLERDLPAEDPLRLAFMAIRGNLTAAYQRLSDSDKAQHPSP